jgi:hypothetical protein
MIGIKERGQANEALSLNGFKVQIPQGGSQGSRVNQLAGLAVELAKIESAIKEQQWWLHPQPCPCEQCSAVFAELLKLSNQHRKILSEIIKLST